MFNLSHKVLSYHSNSSLTKTFLQLFIIVHIKDCSHWILIHVNSKESYIVIYVSVKLKHDKQQSNHDTLISTNFKPIYRPLSHCNTLASFNFITKPFQPAHFPRVLYSTSQNEGKNYNFKITDNKEVKIQGSSSDSAIFILKFIECIILVRPMFRLVQNNMKVQRKKIGSVLLEFCEGNRLEGTVNE